VVRGGVLACLCVCACVGVCVVGVRACATGDTEWEGGCSYLEDGVRLYACLRKPLRKHLRAYAFKHATT